MRQLAYTACYMVVSPCVRSCYPLVISELGYHLKLASHASRTESVASIPRSRKALKKKVAGKTRIRLKVLKWGDGEILPFWQKATKRQAKKRWYAHTYGQVSRSNSQTSYAGVDTEQRA